MIELQLFVPERDGTYVSMLQEDDGLTFAAGEGARYRTTFTVTRRGNRLTVQAVSGDGTLVRAPCLRARPPGVGGYNLPLRRGNRVHGQVDLEMHTERHCVVEGTTHSATLAEEPMARIRATRPTAAQPSWPR